MRQVDTCDFCGDAPDGVFEVVPAAVSDGPVRLALCADCRTTLETVVDPLLAADASDTEPASDGTATADSDDSNDSNDSDDAADAAPNTPTAMRDSPDADEADSTDADSSDDDGVTIESGGSTPAERPDGYAQVLRLLENRDGGMPRGDLRALATNAYDLDERTFETAVDAAVENGDVEDTSGGLRRT
ncbi:hypothetical protein [Halobacterium jilantaiense]|uniref:Uncharacterized protein n=1 Tax=Halobacterium jilantaiense TaxID=355548 RepID=A0A1I0PTS2_9EURY|nr:hypothetical protein [Halobacterium jilantaiense]SEW17779.1 hypothetical protein SAMN04487945_1945 [Halobacterium jilantaiense]